MRLKEVFLITAVVEVATGLALRDDANTPAQHSVLIGILVYDVLAALLLVYSGLVLQMAGLALWPAVALHTLLAGWCIRCLRT